MLCIALVLKWKVINLFVESRLKPNPKLIVELKKNIKSINLTNSINYYASNLTINHTFK